MPNELVLAIAGKNVPWQWVSGGYGRLVEFRDDFDVAGHRITAIELGAYALALIELPNPDVDPSLRRIVFPIEHEDDYVSLTSANVDRGVGDGSNEVVVVYELRRALPGWKRPSLHVAIYPAGTWQRFYEAVEAYEAQEFQWPRPLAYFHPSSVSAFPGTAIASSGSARNMRLGGRSSMSPEDVARAVEGNRIATFLGNFVGYGLVWGIAGLAWAGAVGAPIRYGAAAGIGIAASGSIYVAMLPSALARLTITGASATLFGRVGTVALKLGALAWVLATVIRWFL